MGIESLISDQGDIKALFNFFFYFEWFMLLRKNGSRTESLYSNNDEFDQELYGRLMRAMVF